MVADVTSRLVGGAILATGGWRLGEYIADTWGPELYAPWVFGLTIGGAVVGLVIEDDRTRGKLVYAPGVGSISDSLVEAVENADAVLMDGTFWSDDEMVRLGGSDRTAGDMGHLPVGGPEGSLRWLAGLPVEHRAYIHINNTNPMLDRSSPQHEEVTRAGVSVGADADRFTL